MKQVVSLGFCCIIPYMAKLKNKKTLTREDGRKKARPGPAEQKRLIVEAALPLFLEGGVRSVSVREICEAADVSRSTFYRSFEDVDALLRHIYSVGIFEPVEHFMLANLAKPMRAEDFRVAVENMYEAIFEHRDYAELIFREANDPLSPAFAIVNDTFNSIVKEMQKAMPRVSNRSVDAIYLKSLLIANQWIAFDAIRKGLSAKDKRDAKQAAWRLIENSFSV